MSRRTFKHCTTSHSSPQNTPDTFEQWHPRLSSSNKIQLCQAAHENLFDCQSFFTLATIICYINIEPYQVMNEETGRLVVPRSSILILRRQNRRWLWLIADYICGGKETRHIWHLIRIETVQSDNSCGGVHGVRCKREPMCE